MKWPSGSRKDLIPRPNRRDAERWSAVRRLEHWGRLAKTARTEARRMRAWHRYEVARGLAMIMIAHAHGEPITVEMTEKGLMVK